MLLVLKDSIRLDEDPMSIFALRTRKFDSSPWGRCVKGRLPAQREGSVRPQMASREKLSTLLALDGTSVLGWFCLWISSAGSKLPVELPPGLF